MKKNKKPAFPLFVVVIVIVLIVAISSGGKDKNETPQKIGEVTKPAASETQANANAQTSANNEANSEAIPVETQAPVTEPAQTVYHVGDILHDGNLDMVYMACGDYIESNDFLQPDEGKKYIFLQFAFLNTSQTSDASINTYQFNCYADGYSCDSYFGGDDNLSATLSASRSTSGYLYFTVPQDATEIEIEYEPSLLSSKKITFAFDGDVNSGYVLEKNTQATDGALNVGDTIESKKLNITYLNCFVDTSYSMFSNPKDGYCYITCEFEFENLSDSDEFVSILEFDCFADGISCSDAYFRDDQLSATISSGRKAKGTVTFEVPTNASIIEVEYLTNYWTSNRVVFNASQF